MHFTEEMQKKMVDMFGLTNDDMKGTFSHCCGLEYV